MRFTRGIHLIAAALLFAAAAVAPASAQLGEVPSLADLAGAIGKDVAAPPKIAATNMGDGGLFRTDMAVPSVRPGAAARDLGRMFRQKMEQAAGPQPAFAQFESAMPQALVELENRLEAAGFAKRDFGVAVAYMLIETWETANKQEIGEKTSIQAGKSLATAVNKHWGARYAKIAPAEQERFYESLLISGTLVSSLTEQFFKLDKRQEEAAMRQAAGDLFQKLMGVHPSKVKFTDDGRITGIAFN